MIDGIYLTTPEMEALEGLPHLARVLYIELRRLMDFKTGKVGIKPHRSWQALRERVYVEPHAGIKGGDHSLQQMRRAAGWLVRAKLVVMQSNPPQGHLIFFLQKAKRGSFVPNKADSIPTGYPDRLRRAAPQASAPMETSASEKRDQAEADRPAKVDPDRHRGIGVPTNNHQTTTTSITPLSAPSGEPLNSRPAGGPTANEKPATDTVIYPAQLTKDEKAALQGLLRKHCANGNSQMLLDELAGAIANGTVRNRTAYFRALIRAWQKGDFTPERGHRILETREAEIRATEQRERSKRECAARLDPADQAAGRAFIDRTRKRNTP